jgi:hypothetical protein
MTTVTITITVDADGEVSVSTPSGVANGAGVPSRPDTFHDELLPLPPEPGQFRPITTLGRPQPGVAGSNGLCPLHVVPWRVVPAGVSKKSGKPYAEFRACPEPGCDQRPR